LEIAGQMVPVEALHTPRHTAEYLVEEKRAHSVMEVQGNQASLEAALAAVSREDFPPPATTIDRGHGRVEQRGVPTTTVLNDYMDWPPLGQAFRIDRHVTDWDGGNPRDAVGLGITDRTPDPADAATIGRLVRGHGGIETRLHWVRDVTSDEDRSQVRTQNGPRVMATLRNTAMSLIRQVGVPNIQRAVNYLHRHPQQPVARLLFS
jgi:hypothetical protein